MDYHLSDNHNDGGKDQKHDNSNCFEDNGKMINVPLNSPMRSSAACKRIVRKKNTMYTQYHDQDTSAQKEHANNKVSMIKMKKREMNGVQVHGDMIYVGVAYSQDEEQTLKQCHKNSETMNTGEINHIRANNDTQRCPCATNKKHDLRGKVSMQCNIKMVCGTQMTSNMYHSIDTGIQRKRPRAKLQHQSRIDEEILFPNSASNYERQEEGVMLVEREKRCRANMRYPTMTLQRRRSSIGLARIASVCILSLLVALVSAEYPLEMSRRTINGFGKLAYRERILKSKKYSMNNDDRGTIRKLGSSEDSESESESSSESETWHSSWTHSSTENSKSGKDSKSSKSTSSKTDKSGKKSYRLSSPDKVEPPPAETYAPTFPPPTGSPTYPPPTVSPTTTAPTTSSPSKSPSRSPTESPTELESHEPSSMPTAVPSVLPSMLPSESPSSIPTMTLSGMPSSVPTTPGSNLPTEVISGFPSMDPSESPSGLPSLIPSEMPSSMPTISGSILPTALPSEMPTSAPSAVPSAQPSTEPSEMPSSIPTAVPSAHPSTYPSMMPSHNPSNSPSLSSSNVPSTTPNPTRTDRTAEPTASPTISFKPSPSPTDAPITQTPTYSPTSATPTYSPTGSPVEGGTGSPTASPVEGGTGAPTESPTVEGTLSPTAPLIFAERPDLQMQLFGLADTLSGRERRYYQQQTATYIENFYNEGDDSGDDGSGGGLLALSPKGKVFNMTATLKLIRQEFEEDGREWWLDQNSRPDYEGGVKMYLHEFPLEEQAFDYDGSGSAAASGEQFDDESYLPEFAIADTSEDYDLYNRHILSNHSRQLQTPTDVTEPCVGTNPLILTFSLELSYRTTDPTLVDSDLVFSFPFGAVEFREEYIDDYLKSAKDAASEVTAGEAEGFQDLYCTSQLVMEPIETTPRPTMSPASSEPTYNPTTETETPTIAPVTNGTLVPTSSPSVSVAPSSGLLGVPSVSSAPSIEGTLSPTVSSMPSSAVSSVSLAPSSSMPSTSLLPTPEGNATTLFPTVSNSSMPSSSLSPSSSSLNGTVFPSSSAFPSSSVPSSSSAPSGVNGTAVPSMSSVPTTSLSPSSSATNGTFFPTASTAPSYFPSISSNATITAPGPRSNLQMKLYGLSSTLDFPQVASYEERTAIYIEEFYNKYNDTVGVRGEVFDVVAGVDVTSQEEQDGDQTTGSNAPTGPPVIPGTNAPTVPVTATTYAPTYAPVQNMVPRSSRTYMHDGASEDFLPEYAMDDDANDGEFVEFRHSNVDELEFRPRSGSKADPELRDVGPTEETHPEFRHDPDGTRSHHTQHHGTKIAFSFNEESDEFRHAAPGLRHIPGKKRELQVTSDCTGAGLNLVFTLTLTYRLRGPDVTDWSLDEIINEPFSTQEHRDVYLNNYLKQPDDPITFSSVTCTGEVAFPPDESTPTYAPTLSSVSSLAPSMMEPNGTAIPTIVNTSSFFPTAAPTSTNETGINETSIVPTPFPSGVGGPVLETPPPKSGLGISLFGLETFDDQVGFEQKTAQYIIDFYNDDISTGLGDAQAAVSNITFATVTVTEELPPSGATTGTDCTFIDPFNVTFTLDIQSYVTTDPALAFDDIITYPFSTEVFQQVYIDYLKADDDFDDWEDLLCTSEVRLPEDQGAPSTTLSPTVSETLPPAVSETLPPASTPAPQPGAGVPTVVVPPQRSNLKLSLFGLESLEEQNDFQALMEDYFTDFYNAASPEIGVSDVTFTVVVITDTFFPPGGIATLPDCDLIDPLNITFNLQMGSYTTTDPSVNFDDIIAYPFSTEEFQQTFINDYVVPNDQFQSWEDLLCVSAIQFPEDDILQSVVGTLPTIPASAIVDGGIVEPSPSVMPSIYQDDIFTDIRRSDPITFERKCDNKLNDVLPETRNEFGIPFAYRVESATPGDYDDLIDQMQGLILDFVATSVMRCSEGTHETDPQFEKLRRNKGDGKSRASGVTSIRYPEVGEITTLSECDSKSSNEQGCVVMNTKILITSIDVPEAELHRDILMVLSDAFKGNLFVELVPEVEDTSFLGPDPQTLALVADDRKEEKGLSSKTFAVVVSIICIALLLKLVVFVSFPTTRSMGFKKVFSYYKHKVRYHGSAALPNISGPIINDEMQSQRYCVGLDGTALVPHVGPSRSEDELDDEAMLQFSFSKHSSGDESSDCIESSGSDEDQSIFDGALMSYIGQSRPDDTATLPFSYSGYSSVDELRPSRPDGCQSEHNEEHVRNIKHSGSKNSNDGNVLPSTPSGHSSLSSEDEPNNFVGDVDLKNLLELESEKGISYC